MNPSVDHTVAPALLGAVREDPRLTPTEKETTLRFAKPDDAVAVFSREAGLTRRLLAHPHVEVEGVTVAGDGPARRGVPPGDYSRGDIVGVRACVPVSLLKVSKKPRERDQHAQIVSEAVLAEVEK